MGLAIRGLRPFLGCQDLDAAHAYLVAHGVRAEPPSTAPYGMRREHVGVGRVRAPRLV